MDATKTSKIMSINRNTINRYYKIFIVTKEIIYSYTNQTAFVFID